MKSLILALVTPCLHVSAQQQWIDLPDNYQWESAAKGQKKFKPFIISTSVLSSTLREAVALHWSGPKLPKKLDFFEVDLNGDEQDEIFVMVPKLGGTGGSSFMILSRSNSGYDYVGTVLGFGFEFLSAENGWLKIKGYSSGGGGQHTRYLLTFQGNKYEDVCCYEAFCRVCFSGF